jgi:hypothetical protein
MVLDRLDWFLYALNGVLGMITEQLFNFNGGLMNNFNKNAFLSQTKRKVREVFLPDYDEPITLKSLSAGVVLECQQYLLKGDQAKFGYALVLNSILDEDGKPVFTMEELTEMDYTVLDRLVLEAMDLNNIAPDIVKQAREKLKNLKDSSTRN